MSEEEFLKDRWASLVTTDLLDMLQGGWTDAERVTRYADVHEALRAALEVYLNNAQQLERETAGAPPIHYLTPSLN